MPTLQPWRFAHDQPRNHRVILLIDIAAASRAGRTVTLYFVSEGDLLLALGVAALRGVSVDVDLPEQINLRLVHWATTGRIGESLRHGGRVRLTPLSVDHATPFVTDDEWCLIDSADGDARSLRLNFEFNFECYVADLVAAPARMVDGRIARGRRWTGAELDRRNLLRRLRDGGARLATPYL